VYLITELLTGGELLDAVLQCGHYSEAEARTAFVQLIKGIEYLHSRWAAWQRVCGRGRRGVGGAASAPPWAAGGRG
jgi:serine/threonine protein kinase